MKKVKGFVHATEVHCMLPSVQGVNCDVWWFPGTSDPDQPCYGYWNSLNKLHTPVQFFGLSSLGPTILDYSNFTVGPRLQMWL